MSDRKPADPPADATADRAAQDHEQADIETGGETRVPLLPLTLDGRRLEPRMALPPVGAQSATLLVELGYTPDEIDRLLAAGVVAVPKTKKETERLAS